jgi:tryptophan-specific transport protein
VITWAFTYFAAKLLADVNLGFTEGASFHTMVRSVLGPTWAWVNDIAIAFIMAILMYAYITAGAGILEFSFNATIGSTTSIHRGVLSALFALAVGVFVWHGTTFVSRIITVFLFGLALTFIVANTQLIALADWVTLMPSAAEVTQVEFFWAAMPVFVTAFACAGLVPSLVEHYRTEPQKIKSSLLYGTLVVLLIYIVWLALIFASLPR